jgi:YggT family protein
MTAIILLIDKILDIYLFFIVVWIILGWLVAFGAIPSYNRFISAIMNFLYRITEPALGRIRNFLPPLGGMDLSPIVLILAIYFIRDLLRFTIAPMMGVNY